MTFNEFLIKKKIDSAQFSMNEPGLFSEFEIHFGQMGEKSFDHSKKFWFNKLRRRFHLMEAPKPAKEAKEINELAAQAEPLISPTITASGVTGSSVEASSKESPIAGEQSSKPAYKPRFKPSIVNSVPEEQSEKTPAQEELKKESSELSTPQAYKPRFKAPVKKDPDIPLPDSVKQDQDAAKPKPGYKPRFNSAALNAEKEKESADFEKEPAPKPGYVPRFRTSKLAPKPEVVSEDQKKPEATEQQQIDNPAETSPKPVYKPRFKPGLTKPKDSD